MQEIRKRKMDLIEALTADSDYILQRVQQMALITNREYNNIRSVQQSSERKVIDLVDKVMFKGDHTCQGFLTLLRQPDIQDTYPTLKQLFSSTIPDNPIQETQGTNQLGEYKMTSLPRGYCLIFNNEHFEPSTSLKERKGSSQDAAALSQVFSWLGFTVETLADQTAQDMRGALQRCSGAGHGDAFVCCVLSHGTQQGVYGHDGQLVPVPEILSAFNGAGCPALAGKPKVFFIQACQGKQLQDSVAVVETDAGPLNSRTVPVDCDFLVGMATVPEFLSMRDSSAGSWYIQSLCRQLKECCPKGEDILTILTKVNEEVSLKEGRLWTANGLQLAKQIPSPRFTLRKRLVFPVPSGYAP
ncbi:hypothetical protein MATL_G00152870 [Megalops atlanticus]|uniref:Caspase-8 n=1 Tax=Megalops atlanticus TaxID=7932 RepID=A0A9D3PWY6_MEGAT|nr:hypothetical protein MATL_G00152870 [Megalops atlanticus]